MLIRATRFVRPWVGLVQFQTVQIGSAKFVCSAGVGVTNSRCRSLIRRKFGVLNPTGSLLNPTTSKLGITLVSVSTLQLATGRRCLYVGTRFSKNVLSSDIPQLNSPPVVTMKSNFSDRRRFLRTAAAVSASAVLPGWTFDAPAAEEGRADLTIDSVDVLRVSGEMPSVQGLNRQYQSQPIHLYERPDEYQDSPNPRRTTYRAHHDYVHIRTRSGLEGLYGYADSDAAAHIVGPLRRQLVGQNAMAVELLWDRMYRADRMGHPPIHERS